MFSEAKTRLADLIVSLLCEAGPMPKTQLAKLVLWAEIEYFRRTGRSITGLYFVRQNDGPVIAFWDEVLAEGKGRDWRQQTEPTRIAEEGREKVRYLYEPLRRADWPDDVVQTIQDVVNRYGRMTGSQLSKLSHAAPAWKYAEPGEPIYVAELAVKDEKEYFALIERVEDMSDDDDGEERLSQALSRLSEPAGPSREKVDF